MSTRRILLVGYYGKGNFGDDVLLNVSHQIVKQAMPGAAISIIIDGDTGGYVPAMLGQVTMLPPGRHGQFDLIVHGGGGVYFDFAPHDARVQLIEHIFRAIGLRVYVALENTARCLTGRRRSYATVRLGMGIGVGTYTSGSSRFRTSLAIIADYDALWVRDAASIQNLKKFGALLTGEVILGSDLAFLTQHWLNVPATRAASLRPRLGIILRDWKDGLSEDQLRETIAHLAQEYDITGFIFDRHADPKLQRILMPYTTVIWQPDSMSISDITRILSQQDVLLTSRAHGAICGACVGVPSVIVTIEPKLEQVAKMLPNTSRSVNAQQTETWAEALTEARSISPAAIAADVERNRAASTAALAQLQRWMA